jgi:hypothetical protein
MAKSLLMAGLLMALNLSHLTCAKLKIMSPESLAN